MNKADKILCNWMGINKVSSLDKYQNMFILMIVLGVMLTCYVSSCSNGDNSKPAPSPVVKEQVEFGDPYDKYVDSVINALKPPVILIAKEKSFGMYGIVVIDSNKRIVTFGDLSSMANKIGASRNIGDTIK